MKEKYSQIFSNQKWIAVDKNCETAIIETSVNVSKKENVKVLICGLGFFELRINGKKVSKDLLTPVWSDYEKRDLSTLLYPLNDEFTHRIYFLKYDVTKYLTVGENEVKIELANGWYRQTMRNVEGKLSYGDRLKCAYCFLDENNEIISCSNGEEKYKNGAITQSNVYFGEVWNFNSANKSSFKNVEIIEKPNAIFTLQKCPSDRVKETVKPKLLYSNETKKCYDAYKNISGYACIIAESENVKITYAEKIKDDFSLSYGSCGGDEQIQKDEFINCKIGDKINPKFVLHGFRYFEVVGGRCEEVKSVYSNVKILTRFECNNDVINWYFNAFLNGMTSNMHTGVPSDCPHRERLGYTGDGQMTAKSSMLTLGAKEFYKKWITDILDCQDKKTGHVQHTAPFYGGGGGPGGWGSAIVSVPYDYYEIYRDKNILKQCFSGIDKWIKSMLSFSENGLVVKEIEGGWCLGEWCTPEQVSIPEEIVNTYYFVKSLEKTIEICKIIGREENIFKYKSYLENSKNALKNKYVENGKCIIHGQGVEAFLIDLNLCSKEEIVFLNDYYNKRGTFDTGIFGTDVVSKVLIENGYTETFIKLLSATKFPSFGYMKENGATTLWENWNGWSNNHHMFGSLVKYIINTIVGLTIRTDGKIILKPVLIKELTPIKFSTRVFGGNLSVDIKCENGYEITVKNHTNESVYYNEKEIKPNNISIFRS